MYGAKDKKVIPGWPQICCTGKDNQSLPTSPRFLVSPKFSLFSIVSLLVHYRILTELLITLLLSRYYAEDEHHNGNILVKGMVMERGL